MLAESATPAGTKWTGDGEVREVRGLKHRAQVEPRHVPIPPELVLLLRHHVEAFGTAPDGRLFQSANGGYPANAIYGQIWKRARAAVLTPVQVPLHLLPGPTISGMLR